MDFLWRSVLLALMHHPSYPLRGFKDERPMPRGAAKNTTCITSLLPRTPSNLTCPCPHTSPERVNHAAHLLTHRFLRGDLSITTSAKNLLPIAAKRIVFVKIISTKINESRFQSIRPAKAVVNPLRRGCRRFPRRN